MTAPLHVLTVVIAGGRNRLLNALIDHLPRETVRHEVVILAEPAEMADDLEARGVPLHSLGLSGRAMPALAAVQIARLLRRTRPDIVHSHLLTPTLAVELARATLGRPPRSVQSRHHNRTHHDGRHRVHARLDGLLPRRADRVIAVSDAVRATMVDVEAVDPAKVVVIHNGLDPSTLHAEHEGARRLRRELGTPLAVAVGRLDPEKDYDTLLAAVSQVRQSHPELVLAVAGSGTVDEQARLRRRAADLGMHDYLRLLGWVSDPFTLMAAADVFVQASLDEACPQAITEAAFLGIPLAVTTPGGVREITGASHPEVRPRDVTALAARIAATLAAPAAARAEAALLAGDVQERLTATRMAEQHLGVYQRVAGVTA